MDSFITGKSMLAMFILLLANSKVSGNSERRICDYCAKTDYPGFPSVRDSSSTGIAIGVCEETAASQNKKCSQASDECVIMKLTKKCSTSNQGGLEKYFPAEAEGMKFKGCWKKSQTEEVKSTMNNCGGSVEFIKTCNEDVCNKDEPAPVVHTGVKVAVPVILVLILLIAAFVCWKKNLLCFKK